MNGRLEGKEKEEEYGGVVGKVKRWNKQREEKVMAKLEDKEADDNNTVKRKKTEPIPVTGIGGP
jgi:hypothetical protein